MDTIAGNERGGVRREAIIRVHHYGIHARPYKNITVADKSVLAQWQREADVFLGTSEIRLGFVSERV